MAIRQLKPEHYAAIRLLAQPKQGGLTAQEIADKVGVARSTLFEWKKDPLFERELNREIVRNGRNMLPEVIENMYKVAIETDNAAMAKLVLQLNGLLTDKVELTATKKTEDIDFDELDNEIESFEKRIDDTQESEE